VGIEIEALTFDRAGRRPDADTVVGLVDAAGPLPGAGRVSAEPGGQVEVSTPPAPSVAAAVAACAADLEAVRSRLQAAGITTALVGLDPVRPPVRVTDAPRYRAMQAYFDAQGLAGRTMMCNTASVQVNLDLDGPGGPAARWRRAHLLGPVLAAAFANSPLANGRPTRFCSLRLATWRAIDPSRTAPALRSTAAARDWADYALDARVMFVPDGRAGRAPVLDGVRMRDWIESGRAGTWPTEDDLAEHLTTLFPPVRPRGWLELRFLDALPDPWWRVAVAVTVALLDDEEAAGAAERACAPLVAAWDDAALWGLAHPALATAARALFAVALPALERIGADSATIAATAAYAERFVARCRTPADELLAAWRADPGRTGMGPLAELCPTPAGAR
jgi:glutamate--cysteine ligase